LILYMDCCPPASRMDEIMIFLSLVLYTSNRWVTDPIVVKTVSKKTVSVENVNVTDGLVSI
jgi:hypothetical protein